MISIPLVKYVITAAMRDRLIVALLLAIGIGASLSVFLGSAAVIERDQFALVFTAAGLRFAGVAALILFIVFHIRRSFETRDVDFLLSRPVSRTSFLLSHAIAFSLLGILIAVLVSFALWGVAPHKAGEGLGLWSMSYVWELVIVANVSLFFAMVLTSGVGGVMAVSGFYVLARLMGELIGIAGSGIGNKILVLILDMIALVTPRLDLMAQSSWLVYGPPENLSLGTVILQGVFFTLLVVSASLVDLKRRQF